MLIAHWNFSEWTWKHILGAVIFLVVGSLVIVIYNLIKSFILLKIEEKHTKSLKETSQEELISKYKKTTNIKKRCELIDHITDAEALTEIALNDPDRNARYRAVSHIWDQNALAHIAEKDDEWGVRSAAVKKLTNREVLERIAAQDPERVVRTLAAERIKNLK